MPSDAAIAAVSNAVVTVLPSVISLIQSLFAKQNPGLPPPTSAEVKAVLANVCTTSLLTDDVWLEKHPA